jgi:endoglucanase
MCKKTKMLLMFVVMLSLAGGAQAYTYCWCSSSGNWSDAARWDVLPSPTVEGQALIYNGAVLNVTTTGQGAWDCSVGYAPGGSTITIAAGAGWTITSHLWLGNGHTGVINVYGTAYCRRLLMATGTTSYGTINVYDGGTFTVGDWGCDIGVSGTARVNLIGGSMIVGGTSGITISSLGCINIEAGYLKVAGNQVTQLSGYIANGRIIGYNGAATVAAPVYTEGYTMVAVYPVSSASVPNPTNALSKVPVNKTLTWTAGTYATGHDVYWGTNSTAVTNANRTSPEYKGNYSTPGYQNPDWFGRNTGQTYYWRIDETSGNGAIVRPNGSLWSFSTERVFPISFATARGVTLDRMFQTMPPEAINTIEVNDVKIIRYMGFEFAKVIINPALMISGSGINTTNMAYIDSVMAKFMAQGVPVVICIHPMPEFKNYYLGTNWTNFANLCSFYYYFGEYLAARWGVNEVAFQLMTEPFGNVWAWNNMWIHMYDQARAAMPNHTLILSGDQSGIIEGLVNDVNPDLRVDGNVLWSFTTYYPYVFTFQGGGFSAAYYPWLNQVPYPSNSSQNPANYILASMPSQYYSSAYNEISAYCNTPWNLTRQRSILQPLTTWKNNHPTSNPKLWCAEFGSLDRQQGGGQGGGVNPADRIQFISDRRQAFEEIGIGWAYWSYNETFTCFKPTVRVPFSKTPGYDWVDDVGTLFALAVRPNSTVVYFWSEQSGNWTDPNTWDIGVPRAGNIPGHDVYVQDNIIVNNNQGCTDLHIGYDKSATLTVTAGAILTVNHSLLMGQTAGTPGTLILSPSSSGGWAIVEHLHLGDVSSSSAAITIFSNGYLQVGTWGCDVGSETGGTGLVDLEGGGEMVVLSTLAISGTGRIDIEAGQLAILGDCRTRMQNYINWGRITGYDGSGTLNAPTFDGTYTRITANP